MSNKDPPPPYSTYASSYPYPQQPGNPPNAAYPAPPGFQTQYPTQPGTYTSYAGVHVAQSIPPQPPGAPPYPTYGGTTTNTIIIPNQDLVVVGACPACRVGVLEDSISCAGLLCAIFFFPLGILCCLLMREKQCTNCGARFD